MDPLSNLVLTQDLTDRRRGERPIRWEPYGQRINLPSQRRQTGEWIVSPLYLLRENDVRVPVAGVIPGVHAERAFFRGRIGVIQAEISRHQVRPAVAVEISDCKAVPPTSQRRQARTARYVSQSFSIVSIQPDGHPFSRGDQVEAPVAIKIDPGCIGDHASRTDQLGNHLFGHISKPASVVAQDVTPRGIRILSGREATSDE